LIALAIAGGVLGYAQLRGPARGGAPATAPARSGPAAEKAQADQEAAASEGVAALGRLEPYGDIRNLAPPTTGGTNNPRISQLLVEEGQRVRRGQLLARFDSAPTQGAKVDILRTRISNLRRRVEIAGRDLARYRRLAAAGAFPTAALDLREQSYLELKGELEEARAQLIQEETELVKTELRAPIDGTVLRLNARVGERPGDGGILDLADSDRMEVLLEVYESDINRVRVGQRATITSENGGFDGTLEATVNRISPQVRQREVLSTDPTRDADARIVEVRLRLDPEDAQRVRDLTGLKVIARLSP
jgi:HlyD family secretion protein